MSGFDTRWLQLREPADLTARDGTLRDHVATFVRASPGPVTILDIGCGTGSTYRALGPMLPDSVAWRLMDHDQALLDAARALCGNVKGLELIRGDVLDLPKLPLSDTTIVTASALFDLCSAAFIDALAERLSTGGIALYAALNYDGRMLWSVPHPLDDDVVAAFNRHQRSDKGFGPALGPEAWSMLQASFTRRGYRVRTAASDWVMGPADAALQREFIGGVAGAVHETGRLEPDRIDEWRDFRHSAIGLDDSSCLVGHVDVLALGP